MAEIAALADLVTRHTRPGMCLHFALHGSRPNAAIREIYRQYAGTDPKFVLSSTGFGGPQLGLYLIAAGLGERVVAGFVGDQYPAPGPSRAVKRRIDSGEVDLEDWSLYTFLLRLRAATLGVPWMPTRSFLGSSMGQHHGLREVTVDGEPLLLLPAHRPDVTFLHGVLADEDGNVLLTPPYGEGILGAAAARLGAIVTVERIVSRAEFRRHSGLPTLPASFTLGVAEVPFGAHPSGLYAERIDQSLTYGEDYDFIADSTRHLNGSADEFAQWANTWLRVPAEEYQERLGAARRRHLRAWREWPADEPAEAGPPSAQELICAAAAALIRERVQRANPSSVLAGIGISSLATWLASSEEADFPPLISEVGFIDYKPQPGNPFLFYFPNMESTSVLADVDTVLGGLVQGDGDNCLAVLAAGQIDASGAMNSSWTSQGWITGSGGANDIATGAGDVVVLVPHQPGRLVENVEFVTSPGMNVHSIVTDLCVMRRAKSTEPFSLTDVYLRDGETLEDAVARVTAATPWPISPADDVRALQPPDPNALKILREFDPQGSFLRKTKRKEASQS
ncbi:CoA-transferase [Streptomyces acidicola]|uniref:CoA-transferase n=1 Tax=Streptomyces acidicola TaxID=2596892 RepID=UPI0037FF15AA